MTPDFLRDIRLFQVFLLPLRKLLTGYNCLLQTLGRAHADDRARNGIHHPSQGHLSHRPTLLLRDLFDALHHQLIGVAIFPFEGSSLRRRFSNCIGSERPGETTGGEWTPRNQTDTMRETVWYHLSFLLSVQERILILHAHELRPTILLCDLIHLRKLPCSHGARSDVSDFSRLYEVVERLHRLVDRRLWVEAVDLKEVDVRELQTLQRRFDSIEYRCTRQARLVDEVSFIPQVWLEDSAHAGIGMDEAVALCEDENFVPRDITLLQEFPDNFSRILR